MRALIATTILLAALLAAGCSSDPAPTSTGAEGTSASAPAHASGSASSYEVRELTAQGMKDLLAESRGKSVLACFWSVNCPACEQEIPELEKLADTYAGDGLRVLLINLDPDPGAVRSYFGEHVPVTEQFHGSGDLAEAYGVYAIPHLVLHDAEGGVFFNKAGYFPAKMLEAIVEHGMKGNG
ncbi:MAG: TlpA family protein disulfide reductase [Desulfovibrionaceae bacterium]